MATVRILDIGTDGAALVMDGQMADATYTVDRVRIVRAGVDLLSCAVELVSLPRWCMKLDASGTGELSRPEVETYLKGLAGIALKRARSELLDGLRRLETVRVDWDVSGGKFFGASLGGSGEIKLFLSAWLVDQDAAPADSRLAQATLRVTGTLKDDPAIRATSSITVTVRANGLSFLRVGLDDLNFTFPDVPFPKLDVALPFVVDMPDGRGLSPLLDRLCSVAGEVQVTCVDADAGDKPPRLALEAVGDQLNWAIVKRSSSDPAWGDASRLKSQLATFVAVLDWNGAQGRIDGIQVAGLGRELIASGSLVADLPLPVIGTRNGGLGPFQYAIEGLGVTLKAALVPERSVAGRVSFDRLVLRLANDPDTSLAFKGEVDLTPSGVRVVELHLVDPYPIELVKRGLRALERGARAVATIMGSIEPVDTARLRRLLDILGRFAAAAAKQAYVVGSAIADASANAASVVADMLDSLGEGIAALLRELPRLGAADDGLDVQVTVGLDPVEILQILALRKSPLEIESSAAATGLEVRVHAGWRLGVLVDLAAQRGAYLVAVPGKGAGGKLLTLGTDLWLESNDGKSVSQMPDADQKTGDRPGSRLIQLTASHRKPDIRPIVVLAGLRGGRGVFLHAFTAPTRAALPGPQAPSIAIADADSRLVPLGDEMDVDVKFEPQRLLPLLGMGETGETGGEGAGFLDKLKKGLGQVVWVERFSTKGSLKDRKVTGQLDLGVKAAGLTSTIGLELHLFLDTLRVKLEGANRFALKSRRIEEEALGLTWVVEQADEDARKQNAEVEMFQLDFSDGESAFALNTGAARMELRFGGLSADGEGVVFKVSKFRVGRNGVDISAKAGDKAVRLNGLDVPFRFQSGTFEMRSGRLLEASVSGRGSLPPALVGEADCTLALVFVQTDAGIELQSGKVEIDKKGEPIVCHSTRFTLTVTDLDVGIQKDGGYHFYFLVTGSLRFTPKQGEFEGGLLAFLKDIEINLERTPLTGDARVLARHISFQKALSPKKTFPLFNLFVFELRGFGFHPSSPRFDGQPALNLSGQIKFAEIGDVMQPRIDFHGLWIAPPKKGEALPRISAEGLGVDLQLSGAVKIRGSVLAVDPGTKTVEGRDLAPQGYDTYGFLGEGEVEIPGWGVMQASLGFLEVEKKATAERKKAFFVYLQRDKLAIKIPTGFWTFYMREVGFGFGYRYTLAAIRDADAAPSLAQRILALDEASRRQGDLARFAAWTPDPEGDRFTLALRGAVQAYPAQEPYDAKREEEAENPFFFDLVVALRSDLTLLASLRGYLGVNYADFRANTDNLRERPGLRGYLYISAPRSELLARMIGDSRGHIGERLPNLKKGQVLRKALERVDWSATLYIRPGLFHYELGWPDQLSVRLVEDSNIKVSLRGGMIFRVAEDGILWGYNIEADAWLKFGGSVGSSIGVAIEATLQARFLARLIAYLSWRLQGSLMYGLISLEATVTFSVRAWMEVNLRFTSFTIRIGFSFSLHFSAAIEMVVGVEGVGGRAHARVAVCAFGCTLGVFVGFSFNDSALENARTRVQRFMAMSLTAEQPAEPPQVATASADARVDNAAQRNEASRLAPDGGQDRQPGRDPAGNPVLTFPPSAGREICQTDFWMVLHVDPERADAGGAYALLVPREARARDLAGFFCAPTDRSGAKAAHTLVVGAFDPALLQQIRFVTRAGDEAVVQGRNDRTTHWDAQIPVEAGSAPVSLASLFDECFITSYTWDAGAGRAVPYGWMEPLEWRVTLERAEVPSGSEQQRAARRDQLQKDNEAHTARMQADARAYQGRSTVLAMFLDQFVTVASTGARPSTNEAHVLDTGLVLRGPVDALERLAAALSVEKADSAGKQGRVEVLNPNSGWFARQDPEFSAARAEMAENGPRFAWDLSVPRGGQDIDPDNYLQHYEVLRTVEGREFEPHTLRVKPAATYGGPKNGAGAGGEVKIALLRADWQFSDDLSDLDPEWRRALLPPRDETETLEAARAWAALGLGADVTLTYSVTPMDIAGTAGQPRSFAVTIDRPQPAIRPAQAELRVFEDVDDVKDRQSDAASPRSLDIYLGVRDGAWKADGEFQAGTGGRFLVKRQYRLYVEHEAVLPAGSFGSDGLTDRVRGLGGTTAIAAAIDRAAREDEQAEAGTPRHTFLVPFGSMPAFDEQGRPGGDAFLEHVRDEVEEAVEARKRLNRWALLAGTPKGSQSALTPDLVQVLWSTGNSTRAACRFWLRTEIEIVPVKPSAAGQVVRLVSTPTEVSASIVLRSNRVDPIPLQPQAFEWPVELNFPPLRHGQVRVETGFLHLLAPRPDATLGQWTGASNEETLTVLRDPDRRTLAKLEFDAVPAWDSARVAPLHLCSIAGYDVHELDLDDLAPSDTSLGGLRLDTRAWKRARRIAHVKLVPEEAAMLTPATNADWLSWQAHYPSETWRTQRTDEDLRTRAALPLRKGWYSPAESLPAFAERFPRQRLLPHSVDTTVDELLANGVPTRIRARLRCESASAAAQKAAALRLDYEALEVTAEHLALAGMPGSALDWGRKDFSPLEGTSFSAAQLRYLLLCLCLPPLPAPVLDAWRQDPAVLDGVQLVLEAFQGDVDESLATSIVRLEFNAPMHAILEEVAGELAWGSYGTATGGQMPTVYRKYAVTLQAPPAVEAREFAKFLAATPPSVDPYGWCVLQSLGLAATLRLFDLARGEFVDPRELAERANAVFSHVAQRWRQALNRHPDTLGTTFGQPFAEVLLRPGQDRLARPFDGVSAQARDVGALRIEDAALALIQLSLRPVPHRHWEYVLAELPAPVEPGPEAGDVPLPRSRVRSIRLEIAWPEPKPEAAGEPVEFMLSGMEALARLDKESGRCSLPVRREDANRQLTLVARRQSSAGALADLIFSFVTTVETVDPAQPEKPALETPVRKVIPLNFTIVRFPGLENLPVEPFGRFPEKTAEEWVAAPISVDSVLRNLRFAAPDLKEGDRGKLMPQYIEWARRFLDHAAGPDRPADGGIALALAAPSRLTPFELAADSQGVLTLPIPSEDRLAHARAYAVRAVSRYAHVIAAAQGEGAQAHLEELVHGLRNDEIGYAVAVHPRTERIEPPVILGNAVRRDEWELVLARHGEESLAQSNRPLFARLGKPELLLTQVRSYRTPTWPERLRRTFADMGDVVLYPEHPPHASPPRPPWGPPALPKEHLDALAKSHPSLWKGAEFVSFPGLPPHYKGAALAVARAGIVVSNISAVVQDDFTRANVAGAWGQVPPDPLAVVRDDQGPARLVLRCRLLSHWDLTPDPAKTFAPRDDSDVAWWPDPDVVYTVVHVGQTAGLPVREELLEVRLVAHDAPEAPHPVVLRTRGDRWAAGSGPASAAISRSRKAGASTFFLQVTCRPNPEGPSGSPAYLPLQQDDVTAPGFAEFAAGTRPFATALVYRIRRYVLEKVAQESFPEYAVRIADKTVRLLDAIRSLPQAVAGEPFAVEARTLGNRLAAWFGANQGHPDIGMLLDEEVQRGGFQPFTASAPVLWPHEPLLPTDLPEIQDDLQADGGKLVVWDLPTVTEVDDLLQVRHRLVDKDSAFWQVVVQRVTGGATKLVLRCTDGRGPAAGGSQPVSVGEADIAWPAFVGNVVSR